MKTFNKRQLYRDAVYYVTEWHYTEPANSMVKGCKDIFRMIRKK